MQQTQPNYTTWRICNWTGLIFAIGYSFTWAGLGYNLPPFEPAISLEGLYQHYVDNNTRIKLAFVLSLFFMPMYFVWTPVTFTTGDNGCRPGFLCTVGNFHFVHRLAL